MNHRLDVPSRRPHITLKVRSFKQVRAGLGTLLGALEVPAFSHSAISDLWIPPLFGSSSSALSSSALQ
jgi:hypothetical protein